MWIIDGWMFLGLYGVPYLTLIGVAILIVREIRPFMINSRQMAAILIPIALYIFLTFAIQDRQGFNWGYANLAMAGPGVIAIISATRSAVAYWAGVAATAIAGIAAWLLIPGQGLTRLF